MMNYFEFKEQLMKDVQKCFDTTDVVVEEVNMLNDTKKECVSLREKGKVTPRVYLDDLYESFKMGKTEDLGTIAEMVVNIFKNDPEKKEEIFSAIPMDWDEAKENIRVALVKKEWNQEWLKNKPYIEYLDYAVVFEVHMQLESGEGTKITLTHEMQRNWGVGLQELWETARDNLSKEEFGFTNINDVIEVVTEEEAFMYVAHSRDGISGSAALLRKDLLKKFADEKGTDLYIIPSSIYEILVVVKGEELSADYMRSMVKEINSNPMIMKPEECLSDEVYLYERDTDELKIA